MPAHISNDIKAHQQQKGALIVTTQMSTLTASLREAAMWQTRKHNLQTVLPSTFKIVQLLINLLSLVIVSTFFQTLHIHILK